MDNIYLFDKDDNLLEILDKDTLISYNYLCKGNGTSEFSLDVNEKNDNLKKYNKVGFLDENDEFKLFVINDVSNKYSFYENTVSIVCLDDIVTLGNNLIKDEKLDNVTIDAALSKILENTKYKVGNVKQFNSHSLEFKMVSSLSGLNSLLETYNCEFSTRIEIGDNGKILNKYIDLSYTVGAETGLRFTYDINLNSVEKTVSTDTHFNVLYGVGKEITTNDEDGESYNLTFKNVVWSKPTNPINKPLNQEYVEDLESIEKYGRIEGVYENTNVESEEALLLETYKKLQEVKDLNYSYVVDVEDLRTFKGFEHYKYAFGDSIIILDEDESITVEARILEITKEVDLVNNVQQTKITLGNYRNGLIESEDNIKDVIDSIKDKIDNIITDNELDGSEFPDTLPDAPIISGKGLFATIMLEWSYENKIYYTYELFASKIKDFSPGSTNKIFEGQASAFLHEVNPEETWYYRVRAKNTHNDCTDYSAQLAVNTHKISNSANYFEEASIKDATIGELRLDRGWVGNLVGNHIDARNLTVTDGNGKKTLEIDSFGRVKLDVTSLKISANSVPTLENVRDEIQDSINNYKHTVNKELNDIKNAMDNLGNTLDGAFKDGIIDESEAIAIKQQIQNLEIEKKDIDSVYNSLYSNADLTGTAKNNLYNAKTSYNTAHTNLINAINDAIADKKISTNENTLVKRAFANYGTALATFRTRNEEALDAIANKKKQDAIKYTDTQFNILDGKIQSKITSADAQSIATQTVNSFKHEVSNTYISKENANNNFLSKNQASSLTAGLQKNLIIGGNFKLQVFDAWDNSRKRNIKFYTTTTGLAGITVREWNYEGWIYSNHVNVKAMNSNKISFAVKMKVESNLRGAEVFLGHYGANKNLIREVWIGEASAGFEGEIVREGYTIPSDVHYVALRIDHNGLKRNTDSNVVLFLEYINLVEGDTVPHTFLQDDGISLKESYSKIEQTADGIKQTVSKKVNSDEIISAINQTAEVIQIQASRINLDGYVFVSSQLKAPHITGSALVYIEEGGILSCDGETYATKLYITNLARDCYFSSDAPAYFNSTLLAKKGLTATDRIHAKNGLSVTDGITATGNMILNGYTVIKNNSLGVESNIYCTNGTVEARNLKVNNSGTVSGTLTVSSTLYVGGSLEVKKYGTTLAQLEVNGATTLRGYTVIKNNSLGVEGSIYCNGNIEALQSGKGQINANYLGSMGNIACRGTLSGSNLSISGSKNCVQETENFGKRLINAYETADYLFGDVGESTIENGECIVYLDDIFKEVITTDITYQVFLTKYGKGDIWVSERHKDYFIVQGDNDISFGWEIKAKRKGYENYRLEEYVEENEYVQENNTI